jgi:hypothetical protein
LLFSSDMAVTTNPRRHYLLICRMLREALLERPASGGFGSVMCRATAALYAPLLAHPVDHRGRCPSCGWAGAVPGRRRRIYRVAWYWLGQPCPARLVSDVASGLGVSIPPPPIREYDWSGLTITGRGPFEDPPRASGTSAFAAGGALCSA